MLGKLLGVSFATADMRKLRRILFWLAQTRQMLPLTYASSVNTAGVPQLTAAGTTGFGIHLLVPVDYLDGSITAKLMLRMVTSTGTAVIRVGRFRLRDGEAPTTLESNINADFTPGDLLAHVVTIATFTSDEFQAGDVLRVDVTRSGDDAGDTGGAINVEQCWVEYRGAGA